MIYSPHMSVIARYRSISEADKSKAVEKLVSQSTPDFDFFLMAILSMLMATFGLLIDSVAVVIGSMLIAPILYPILSLALGLAMSDHKLIGRSLYTFGKAIGLGMAGAVLATLLFSPGTTTDITNEIISRTEPSLVFFGIALIAGIAVSFALVKPELSETLPGIAVSVALIPPLAVAGIGIAKFNLSIISGSLLLFFINVFGILAAAMVSFSLMDVYGKRKLADTTIKKEDARVEREDEKVKEIEEEEKEEKGNSQ